MKGNCCCGRFPFIFLSEVNALNVTLDEVKEYLRIDTCAEDTTLDSLMNSAYSLCLDISRLDESAFDAAGGIAKTAVLYAIAYFYEHRDEADHRALTMTLMCLLMGIRREGF